MQQIKCAQSAGRKLLNSTNIKTSLSTVASTVSQISGIKSGLSFDSVTIQKYITSLQGLSRTQAETALSAAGLESAQRKQILSALEASAATKSYTAEQILERVATELGSEADANALLSKAKIISATELENGATIQVTAAKIDEAVANGALTVSHGNVIKGALGVATANTGEAASFGLLTKAVWANIKAMATWLVTNPIGWAAIFAGGIFAINKYIDKLDEARQKTIELGKETAKNNKDLSSLIEQYHKLGEDGLIDTADQETAKGIQEQIVELVGEQADELDLINGKYDEQIKKLKQIKENRYIESEATLSDAKDAAEANLLGAATMRTNGSRWITTGAWQGKEERKALEDLLLNEGFSKYLYMDDDSFPVFEIDNSSAKAVVKSYKDMVKLRNVLVKSYKEEIDEGGALNDFYNALRKKCEEMSGSVDEYQDALDNYDEQQALQIFNNAKGADGKGIADSLGLINGALISNEDQMKSYISSIIMHNELTEGTKTALIEMAKTRYPEYADAIGNSTVEILKNQLAQADSAKISDGLIAELAGVAKQCGITGGAFANLVYNENIFNNAKLSTEAKVQAILDIAEACDIAGTAIKALSGASYTKKGNLTRNSALKLMGIESENDKGYNQNKKGLFGEKGFITMIGGKEQYALYDRDGSGGYTVYDTYTDFSKALVDDYSLDTRLEIEKMRINAENTEVSPMGATGSNAPTDNDNSGSSSSDKNDALDNYLEDAERRYKIHQDETKYINDLDYALSNLVKTEEERRDVLDKIEQARKDYADNQVKDIEHLIEMTQNLKGENADVLDYYKQIQEIAHNEANRLRSIGYDDNSDEIQEWQNKWWDAQNKQADWYFEDASNWIEDRNFYDDWDKYADNEFLAWGRVIDRLEKDFPEAIDKIDEAKKNQFTSSKEIIDDNLNQIDRYTSRITDEISKQSEALDDVIAKEEALLRIKEGEYDITNKLNSAQRNIDKELRAYKIGYKYLTDLEKVGVFNEEDYDKLSRKISDIRAETDALSYQFYNKIDNLAEDEMYLAEAITSEYERQLDMKERELEIAQAEVDLQKKQDQLNNVLAEKNVRLFKDGQWIWTYDADKARQAAEELADIESDIAEKQLQREQQIDLNQRQASIDNINAEKSAYDYQIKVIEEASENLKTAIEDMREPIQDISVSAQNLVENGINPLTTGVNDLLKVISKATNKNYASNSSSNGGSNSGKSSSGKGNSWVNQVNEAYYKGDMKTVNDLMNKPLSGYASGVKSATSGWHIYDETQIGGVGSEIIATKDGVLRKFEGGETVFNPEQVQNLFDLSQLSQSPPIPYTPPTLPDITPVNQNNDKSVSFNNPQFHFHEVQDGQGAAKEFINLMKQMKYNRN